MRYLPWRFTPKQYLLIGLGVAVLVAVTLLYRQVDVAAVHRRANGLNGFVVFGAVVALPLVGFPVSVAHAVAGLRFGIGWGSLLVAFATLLQLLGAYGVVKLAPGFFERRVASLRTRLPAGAHVPVTIFTMLLPGAPYFAQLYVLPLMGVPLGTYLRWSLPINIVRSVVGVTFGGLADHLTVLRLAGFVAYYALVTVTCSWAFRSLRRKIREQENALGQPTPLAEPVGGWDQFLARRREARRQREASRR